MKYSDLLESRSSPLYHLMTIEKALSCFENNEMPAKWKHDIPTKNFQRREKITVYGNSFSRNKNIYFGPDHIIKITVDQFKLNANNKIIPLDGEYVHRFTHDGVLYYDKERNFAEEFVVGDIKNFISKITHVHVGKYLIGSLYDLSKLIEILDDLSDEFSLTIHEKTLERLEDYNSRYDESL